MIINMSDYTWFSILGNVLTVNRDCWWLSWNGRMMGVEAIRDEEEEPSPPVQPDDEIMAGRVARKVLTADGDRFVFTVALDPKHRPQSGDNFVVFEIPAKGPHSDQKTVQIQDHTAKPHKRFPYILLMRTVAHTLSHSSGDGEKHDFGQGKVAVCTKCLKESTLTSLLSGERTSVSRHAGRHVGSSVTDEVIHYADKRVLDAFVAATVYSYFPASFLASRVVLEHTHGLGVGRDAFATLIDSLMGPVRERLGHRVSLEQWVSVAFDKWTIFGHTILGVAVVTPDFSAVLGFYAAPDVVFDANVAADATITALRDFDITPEKIVTFCSDAGGVERAAVRIMHGTWAFDMLHLMGLAVEDLVTELKVHSGFRSLFKEFKSTSLYYHYSSKFPKWQAKHAAELQPFIRAFPEVAWHPERIATAVKTRPLSQWRTLFSIRALLPVLKQYALYNPGAPVLSAAAEAFLEIVEPIFRYLYQGMEALESDSRDLIFNCLAILYEIRAFFVNSLITLHDTPEFAELVTRMQVVDRDAREDVLWNALQNAVNKFVEGVDKRMSLHHKNNDAVVPLAMALLLNPNYDARAVLPSDAEVGGFDETIAEAERRLRDSSFRAETRFTQAATLPASPAPPGRVGLRGRVVAAPQVNEYVLWQANRTALPEGVLVSEYWKGQAALPKLQAQALRLSARLVTSCMIERAFSQARSCLDYTMAASALETIQKRFFLYANRDIVLEILREHPELYPVGRMLRIV
jgi:hypothetical protein